MGQAGQLLIYGANGFTGRLLLERLRSRGVSCIVAGRSPERVARVARDFQAPHRVFELGDADALVRGLAGVAVVVNVAGPFQRTAEPLVSACLRVGAHYLDVSGEVAPLAAVAARGEAARARGVMLLPGIGFDVVPSDCLALYLSQRVPDAERLILSIWTPNLISRGSALSFTEHLGEPVCVRRAGALEPLWFRNQVRWVDFGREVRPCIAASWGDLVTAFFSTGIANIEVYFEANAVRSLAITLNQLFGWMYRAPGLRASARTYAGLMPDGPSERARRGQRSIVVGEVSAGPRRARARLTSAEPYTVTALAGAAVIERVLGGRVRPGFQTPAQLLGADFVLSLEGVTREDLP